MKKPLLISVMILSGCATVSTYQSDCFEQYFDAVLALECTKTKMQSDPRRNFPINKSKFEELYALIDLLKSKIQDETISEVDAKYVLTQKINELRNQNGYEKLLGTLANQQGTQNHESLSCNVVGNSMTCQSF